MAPPINAAITKLSLPRIPDAQAWAIAYDGAQGPLIDLSQAVPGYPASSDLLALLGASAASHDMTGYGAIEGEASLRDAYARNLSARYAAEIGAEHIHITSGCNQAFVAAALATAETGSAVLMTNPCYFNHESSLAMLGVGTRYVDCQEALGFLPDIAAVRAALTPDVRALALVSPNNPTGSVYSPDLLSEIFALCRDADIWLILDETYRDFLPDGSPHGLLNAPGWEETLIQLYSFSKSFCIPGHRLGAIAAGPRVIEAVAKIMDNLQICAPRAAQSAVAQAMEPLAAWRAGNRLEIERRASAMRETLADQPDWGIGAMGAYFAYLRHPFEGRSSTEVAKTLATRYGVSCLPGSFFGEGQDAYLRLAFANADVATIRGLAERLAAMSRVQ